VQAVKARSAGKTTECTREDGTLTGYGYDEAEGASDNRSRVSSRLGRKARGRGRGGEHTARPTCPLGLKLISRQAGRQAEGKERVGFECQRQRAVCSSLTLFHVLTERGQGFPALALPSLPGARCLGSQTRRSPYLRASTASTVRACVSQRPCCPSFPRPSLLVGVTGLGVTDIQSHWERHVLAACETRGDGHGITLLTNRLLSSMQTSMRTPVLVYAYGTVRIASLLQTWCCRIVGPIGMRVKQLPLSCALSPAPQHVGSQQRKKQSSKRPFPSDVQCPDQSWRRRLWVLQAAAFNVQWQHAACDVVMWLLLVTAINVERTSIGAMLVHLSPGTTSTPPLPHTH
jgi:hypothetical protein